MNPPSLVRRLLVLAVAAAALAPLTGTPGTASAATKTIRIGHGQTPGSAVDQLAHKFADALRARSNGELTAQVYPSSQLGKELDRVQLLQLGGEELDVQGDILMSNVCPEWGLVITTPFVIRSREHFRKVVDGPLMQPAYDCLLQRKGIRSLGWVDRGVRQLTANKPVREPDAVKGLKLRVPAGVEAYVAAWTLLGATIVPMDISELFLGLRQGTINAEENPLEMVNSHSLFEVQKYVNQTAHLYTGFELVGSDKWMKTLTPKQQKAVTEAAADAIAFGNKEQAAEEAALEKQLRAKGMTFVPVDRPAFETALKDINKQPFAARWAPGFYEAVRAVK